MSKRVRNAHEAKQGITSQGAMEMARRIAGGKLSSREVVEAHMRRIGAVNPQLNALVVPLFDQAREEAIRADQAGAGQARRQNPRIGRLEFGPKGNHMSQEKTDATSALATPGGTLRARGTHCETDTES